MSDQNSPPGWYPTPDGQRYWDGQRWTDQFAPQPAGQPIIQVNADNSNNSSLAPVTSLVCGLIALLGCSWIPLIQLGAVVFGPLAILFGVLGVQRGKAEHKIMSWIGIVTGALATIIAVIFLIAIGNAAEDIQDEIDQMSRPLSSATG